jgi:hypothetical protein
VAERKYRKRTPEEHARSRESLERMARVLEKIEREEGITREKAFAAIERLRESPN